MPFGCIMKRKREREREREREGEREGEGGEKDLAVYSLY